MLDGDGASSYDYIFMAYHNQGFPLEKLLIAANSGIVLCILSVLGCVAIGYPFADHFSMGAQIAAHVGILLFGVGF